MFCTKCGTKIPDGEVVCPNCGAQEEGNVESSADLAGMTRFAGQQMNKAMEGVQAKAKASAEAYRQEQEDRKVKNLSELFIDPDEEQVAVIGSNYLDSMLRGGVLSKGFGFVTNKRFYFQGQCYTKIANNYRKIDEEYVVDLEDITATGFVYARSFLLQILMVISVIWGIWVGVEESEFSLFLCGIIVAAVFGVIYVLTKRAMYEVHFAGAKICINVSKYGGTKEVKAFNKAMRLAKDRCKK